MNVFNVTTVTSSGAALYVKLLVENLHRECQDLNKLICPVDFEYYPVFSHFEPLNTLPSISARRSRSDLLRIYILQSLRIINYLFKSPKDSIFHFNFPGIPFLFFPVAIISKIIKRKIILTVHDVYPHNPVFKSRIGVKFEKLIWESIYALCDGLICHSESQKIIIETRLSRQNNISIIPHGPFQYKTVGEAAEFTFLIFGSIRRNKSVLESIVAFQELVKEFPGKNLLIAGKPYEREREYWEMCLKQIKLSPDGIKVIDRYIDDGEIGEIFGASSCVILPYGNFSSQSGVANLAAASGVMVAATNSGGLGDFISHGAAFEIEGPEAGQIYKAMIEIIDLEIGKVQDIKSKAFALSNEYNSWTIVAKKTVEFYKRIASERD